MSDEDKDKMTKEEIEDYEYQNIKIKRRTLGNITLIGELFKLGILTEKIMHEWYAAFLFLG